MVVTRLRLLRDWVGMDHVQGLLDKRGSHLEKGRCPMKTETEFEYLVGF